MKLGFTGTAGLLTPIQTFVLHGELSRQLRSFDELHHGDCVGADLVAHRFVRELQTTRDGIAIVGHPPINSYKRAWADCDVSWMPRDFIVRNHDIVDVTERMMATPATEHNVLRSGEWATIRYALTKRRPLTIIYPSGRVERKNWNE